MIQMLQSPGLKGFVGRTTSRKKLMAKRASYHRAIVESANLDQRAKEDVLLNFFQRTLKGFCIKVMQGLHLISPNFGGIF